MKNLLAITLATLAILALVAGCTKTEAEAPATEPASSVAVTTQPSASTLTTATTPAPSSPPTTTASVTVTPAAEEIPVYSWEEAVDHVGETATVIGPVVAADEMTQHSPDSEVVTVILMLGKDDVDGVLIQMIEFDMESLPEDLHVGQIIAVTGYVNERGSWDGESGARIVVDDLLQIEIEEVPVYSWEEAFDHLNETATVTGPVIVAEEETYPGGDIHVLLILGENDIGGVLVQLMVDRESLPEDLYVGHTISVTGYIGTATSFSGDISARFWVDDLSQIEIIE